MNAFDELKQICDKLHGPDGCPWDKKQTFQSMRSYLLEETHELLEAVDEDDTDKMVEELGDVLFLMIFYAKLGEISGRFTLKDVIEHVREKIVRRHPHVFDNLVVESADDVANHWEQIKKIEKKERKHELEGIPKTLGSLARAQKVIGKMMRKSLPFPKKIDHHSKEELIGDQFIDLVTQACAEQIDAEGTVRKALKKFEKVFIESEEKNS